MSHRARASAAAEQAHTGTVYLPSAAAEQAHTGTVDGVLSLAPTPRSELPRRTRVRHALNWANLSTPLGLAVAKAGGSRVRPGPNGLLLAEEYRWRFPTGGAFTVGDVVITRHNFEALTRRNPHLLEHEEQHSRQWMACLGLPFLPLYTASMGWSWLRTGDRAARSFFERNAGLAKGGYVDVPSRPLAPALAKSMRKAIRRSQPPTNPGATP